jgi:hypothetical protein
MGARTTTGCVVGLTVAGVLMSPVAAFASPAHRPVAGLAETKAKAVATIDLRLRVLRQDARLIARAKHLSSADRTSLGTVVAQDVSGLSSLRTKIIADADAATVKTDAATVYTGYRVFLLLQPQLRDVISADSIVAGAEQVSTSAAALRSSLSTAGTLTADETTLLDRATTDASAATSAVNGEVSALLALTPAMVTKTMRPAALATARADDKAARKDLVLARGALSSARKLAAAAAAADDGF